MLQIPIVAISHLLDQLCLQLHLYLLIYFCPESSLLLPGSHLSYPHSPSDTCANPEVPGS